MSGSTWGDPNQPALRLSTRWWQPLDLQAQLECLALPTSFTPVHPATSPTGPLGSTKRMSAEW